MDAPIPIERAQRIVASHAGPGPVEQVGIEAALDRTLREELRAAADAPPFDCSAMDGYAVKAGPAGRVLELAGESRAGAPAGVALEANQALRISTGGAVPVGAQAVIRQEDVSLVTGRIETLVDTPPGENIRRAGEDLRAGTLVLSPGTLLGPAELAAAVGAGRAEVTVAVPPRGRVMVTGDELRPPGEALSAGQIHDSNGPMLRALVRRAGSLAAEGQPGRLPDDAERTREALAGALDSADVVIVSGGVSVGPHDHVKGALRDLGVQEHFWRVALRPGGPTWFGHTGRTLVFGLPGNPVSAAVTFSLFVRPALHALLGRRPVPNLPSRARMATAVRTNPLRAQAIRVTLAEREGEIVAAPHGPQGSHITRSLVGADALALIPPGPGELAAGTWVELVPAPG